MTHMTLARIAGICLLAAATGCAPSTPVSGKARPTRPLDFGWEFACAITNTALDLSDRCQAQEKVALAHLAAGDVTAARSCAVQIEDWRKGMVLVNVAEWLVAHGEAPKAEAMLPEIEACGFLAKDWQRDWLRSGLTRLQALLGHDRDVAQGASKLAFHPNLGGDAVANLALLLARTGRVDEARSALDALAKTNNVDTAVSRAQGYLELVVAGRLNANATTQVVMNAWQATELVKPYRRWELQMQVLDAMMTSGLATDTRRCLAEVSSNVVGAAKLPPEIQATLLSQAAILWGRLGEPRRGDELLVQAEQAVDRRLEPIFRPSAYATLAAARAASGDAAKARDFYRRALDTAAGLVNRRPRASAGVDVCVSLAGHKEVIDADIQRGLERLLATFQAAQP